MQLTDLINRSHTVMYNYPATLWESWVLLKVSHIQNAHTHTTIHTDIHKGWASGIKGSGLTVMKCDSLLIKHFAHFAALANFALYHRILNNDRKRERTEK